MEIAVEHQRGAFRSVYVVNVSDRVYVLHAFQTKSRKGIATPKADIELIRQRLRRALELQDEGEVQTVRRPPRGYVQSSGNVFADLELPNAEEALVKAELASQITESIERRGLTQSEASKILNVDQPKVSALKRGRLSGFSVERLMRFLVLLDNDVDIIVKTRPKSRARGQLRVA
jgi:predicted XRE-type DNA-binding protein